MLVCLTVCVCVRVCLVNTKHYVRVHAIACEKNARTISSPNDSGTQCTRELAFVCPSVGSDAPVSFCVVCVLFSTRVLRAPARRAGWMFARVKMPQTSARVRARIAHRFAPMRARHLGIVLP